ncbi:MAG: PadR family transcriptional regulator, partial [Clostridia bacterium]|nr:PadR family transcriptional regulator [Clostridia bacterium]
MQEDNFNDSQRNDPYEIKEDNDGTELSVSDSSAATGEVQPDDKAETAEPSENAKGNETNSISSDLIRGHINTIILRALYERDKYGYEIMDDIEQKSHGQYSLKQPTLYSALKRLENQGYLKAYWKTDEVSNGGRRKYFTLTENGKEITEKNLAEWEYS